MLAGGESEGHEGQATTRCRGGLGPNRRAWRFPRSVRVDRVSMEPFEGKRHANYALDSGGVARCEVTLSEWRATRGEVAPVVRALWRVR